MGPKKRHWVPLHGRLDGLAYCRSAKRLHAPGEHTGPQANRPGTAVAPIASTST